MLPKRIERPGRTIIIEGLIAAGKTSLAIELGRALGDETTLVLLEPADGEHKNPYLVDYYSDQERYALPMQIWLLYQRYNMHLHAQYHVQNHAGDAVLDRSYFGDVSFARVQRKLGFMDERDFGTYLGVYHAMTRHVLFPAVCIRLLVDPKTSLYRINRRMEDRAGRKCESVVDIGYLQALDEEITITTEFLRSQGTMILDIGWDTDRETEEQRQQAVDGIIQRILSHTPPSIAAAIHQRVIG